MPLSPGTRLGPFEIIALIGAGGMGEVYRARDGKLGRDVAIKILPEALAHDPQRMARFEREAKVLAALNHPNIATIYSVETGALVMELVEGDTLSTHLRKGPLPVETVLRYAGQIADALAAAHAKGIVHRDLKPGNIMLAKGMVKVLDFGLARFDRPSGRLEESGVTETLTQNIVGTLPYMAPEQLEGKECDARTDIFAAGLVICEMATGKRVFNGESQPAIITSIMRCQIPDLEAAPAALTRAIRGCLARDPDERWQTARELRIALGTPVEVAVPAGTLPPPRKSRERWAWVAATVMALVALALVIARFIGTGQVPNQVTFQILPPEGGAFASPSQPLTETMAVSPDGLYVAFAATVDGRTLLWIRALNSLSARPLAGTEGAFSPFWSPDSRSVAFFAAGQMKKIDVAGGPPQKICDVPATVGTGTWGSRGDILFSDILAARAGINRVSAQGGEIKAVTKADPSKNEGQHFWPQFLPDGKRFLYLVGVNAGSNAVFAASIDGGEPKLLMQESSHVGFAAPGYLIFAREGSLLAQRFHEQELRLEGAPLPIVQEINYFQPTGEAPFSISETGVLAYQGRGNLSKLVWVDRNGREIGTVGPPLAYEDIRLSPDGKRLAVAIADPRIGNDDLHIIDLARESSTQITFAKGSEFTAVWSPDGRRIVYSWDNKSVPYLHEKVLDNSSPGEPIIQPSGGVQVALEWLPDGSILYSDFSSDTNQDLWLLPGKEDRKPRKILASRFNESSARVSPGPESSPHWIAYVSDESGRPEVYVRSFPQLGKLQKISNAGGRSPHWSPNGKELFYVEGDRLMAVAVKLQPEFEADRPQWLFRWSPGIIGFEVTGEGRFLVNSGAGGYFTAPISIVSGWTALLKK